MVQAHNAAHVRDLIKPIRGEGDEEKEATSAASKKKKNKKKSAGWDMSLYETWLAPARKLLELERRDRAESGGNGRAHRGRDLGAGDDGGGREELARRAEILREIKMMEAQAVEEVMREQRMQAEAQEKRRLAAAATVGIAVIPSPRQLSRSSNGGSSTPSRCGVGMEWDGRCGVWDMDPLCPTLCTRANCNVLDKKYVVLDVWD